MLYSTTLFLICFIYSSLYLIPNFWFIPPPPTFPFGKFVFYVPFLKKNSVTPYLLNACYAPSCLWGSWQVLLHLSFIQFRRNVVSCQFCSWKDRLRVWRTGHALGKSLRNYWSVPPLCHHHLWVPRAVLPLLTTQEGFLGHSYPKLALPSSGPYSSPFSNF